MRRVWAIRSIKFVRLCQAGIRLIKIVHTLGENGFKADSIGLLQGEKGHAKTGRGDRKTGYAGTGGEDVARVWWP
jgi:hypothetical protein